VGLRSPLSRYYLLREIKIALFSEFFVMPIKQVDKSSDIRRVLTQVLSGGVRCEGIRRAGKGEPQRAGSDVTRGERRHARGGGTDKREVREMEGIREGSRCGRVEKGRRDECEKDSAKVPQRQRDAWDKDSAKVGEGGREVQRQRVTRTV